LAKLQHPEAFGVAIKKRAFGEGQERLAFQFFEIAEDGRTVVGAPMVSKESRYIDDSSDGVLGDWKARDKFAKRFCKMQHKARTAAQLFNEKLNSIDTLDPNTPRVSFLDCSVYYVTPPVGEEVATIVERRLEGKFSKWNNNNGFVRRHDPPSSLSGIKEEPENNEDDDDDDIEIVDCYGNPMVEKKRYNFSSDEVAQAFSHFSYVHSSKKMLICDLQGRVVLFYFLSFFND
jgi:hypothetical protein